MNLKYIYLLSFLCLLLAGCSEDDPIVSLSQYEFKDIPYEGGSYEIELTTAAQWTATSLADWCKVSKNSGEGGRTITVEVQANLGDARTGNVVIYAEGEKSTLTFSQQAMPDDTELKYQLPIIFHVIYYDETDKNQNPDAETLYKILEQVNEFYRQAGANSPDLNMEFVPATLDPQGNKLAEPGIERIKWVSPTLDPEDVMGDNTRKYTHFLWEPKDYINVLLYNFSTPQILGISTFPYSPAAHPLEGTQTVDNVNITLENLQYVHGLSINSSYIYNSDDALSGLAPESIKDIINKQNQTYITLAHELGHYFGLRHTFSEATTGCADTDFCTDTPSYDKYGANGYDVYVQYIFQMLSMSPDFASTFNWNELFMRTDCNGEPFESHNIMDYAYCYLDEFTPQQRARVRHVLDYSPLIPGPKQTRSALTRTVTGPMDLPFTVSDGYPRTVWK